MTGWPWHKSKTQFKKITKAKRADGVLQVVEHTASKHKAPSSNLHLLNKSKMIVKLTKFILRAKS
jgi:hypothetical protein